jgi:hypothetical protein
MIAAVAISLLERMPKTVKASLENLEERNTIHPRFITKNFMNMLEALGNASRVVVLRTHIREGIFWNNNRIPLLDLLRRSTISPGLLYFGCVDVNCEILSSFLTSLHIKRHLSALL